MRRLRLAIPIALALIAVGIGGAAALGRGPSAADVEWARCLRAHGVPSFPNPDPRGAFDSSKFDDRSPAFQAASKACAAQRPTGAVAAVPGRGYCRDSLIRWQ
jgi:hypothetical protein